MTYTIQIKPAQYILTPMYRAFMENNDYPEYESIGRYFADNLEGVISGSYHGSVSGKSNYIELVFESEAHYTWFLLNI